MVEKIPLLSSGAPEAANAAAGASAATMVLINVLMVFLLGSFVSFLLFMDIADDVPYIKLILIQCVTRCN
jgi:hypothetical protein